ncbi:hypothetical protein AOL60_20460 [Salmonella enterica]|uniref:Lipoprotein n=4 Tax=Salmonella enterica TaxID=28901 RepID=A0A616AL98_SALER|nr:hypothetical protein [Salmonella enterica]EAQ4370967.1 hypothetical protein [Salmonella enterica subsp. enterica]EBW5996351.1 hypothetical protein [Salmonella enterica subsp. enterica serovar Anatum]EBX5948590.1 hypothetical protein [Salmonella enterica subsp. enterica serovar Newport]ECE0151000.1 hypothetical protein [Salmonella enterica subsp. enterica serovar Tallahassee]ECS5459013.1 hypothetical protein [Salmonella enterica subsp. enterica serovar Berta]ECS7317804.1 hypothetical protei
MKSLLMVVVAVAMLAGCTTQAERLAKCQSLGVSLDACYAADMQHETAIQANYHKQALEDISKDYYNSQNNHKHHHHG